MISYKLELRKSTHVFNVEGKYWCVFAYPTDPNQKPAFDNARVSDIGSYLNSLSKQVYAVSDHVAIYNARKALGI